MSVIILHNPRCSKSRQTLALIEEQGIVPQIVEYLKTPPDATELKRILGLLGMSPRELMRKGEEAYKANDLGDKGKSDDELIAAMVENPILIERPIVLAGGTAKIGRPPEGVLDILPDKL